MPAPGTPAGSKLAEARAMTLRDHIANVFRLVIKELRSIRSDPTMLILVVYAFTISVNTVATGAVTEATNLSVGIADEDGSELSRQIAESLVRPTFQPAVHIRASDIDAKMDKGELLFVVEIPPNFQADILAQRKTEVQINVDATAVAQAGNGANYLKTAIANEVQHFLNARGIAGRVADQSRRARGFQSEPENGLVLGDDAGHQSDHAADRDPHRRGADPRARAGHRRASSGHAGRAGGNHAGEDVRQWTRHLGGGDAVAAIRRALVDRRTDRRLDLSSS